MENIWHVSNKKYSQLNLWRVEKQEFQVTQIGSFECLIRGSDYTLIHKDFTKVFDLLLSEEIVISNVSIFRKTTNQQWNDYVELDIKKHLNPEKIDAFSTSENDIWQYAHHLFVSDKKKKEFEQIDQGKLNFSKNFSHFG